MFFWNRKEVFNGHSLEKFDNIMGILHKNNIKCKYKVVNKNSSHLSSSRRSMLGSLGEDMKYYNLHYIYVHKEDYDKAVYVIRNDR